MSWVVNQPTGKLIDQTEQLGTHILWTGDNLNVKLGAL
jgi:hypothetical protein